MSKRPRILLVGPFPPTKGGVTTFMLNLVNSYIKTEFDFVQFTTSRPPKINITQNWGYAAVFRGGWRRIAAGIAITLWHLVLFPFVVVGRSISVVQIQASDYQVFWEAALYALMARMLGRPVMFRIGGAFDTFYMSSPRAIRRLISLTLRLPNCLIVQSKYARDFVFQVGRRHNVLILPNWSRAPADMIIERPLNEHPTALFIAGTEAIRKGVEEVIAAMRCLDLAKSPVRFHLVAVPPTLAKEIRALGLSNITKLEGPVEHETLLKILKEVDIFLLPSHGEGFPNSLIEAMAAGVASIVTPIAAIPEIVADGGAITVPVGDSDALTNAIELLTVDRNLRHRLSIESQKTISAYYIPTIVLPRLAEWYTSLAKKSHPRS